MRDWVVRRGARENSDDALRKASDCAVPAFLWKDCFAGLLTRSGRSALGPLQPSVQPQ